MPGRKTIDQKCKDFTNKLKKAREDKKITTFQLAELTGIAQPNITRMETHKSKPGLETIIKIMDALEIKTIEIE